MRVQGNTTAACARAASEKGRCVIPETPMGQHGVESTAIVWGGHYPEEAQRGIE